MTNAADLLMERYPGTPGETPVQIRLAVPLSRAIAAPFILEHHYSGTVPTSNNIFYGCYVNDVLFAVANYGRIASRSPPAVVLKREDATHENTLELRRLCRVGAKGEPGPVKMSDFLRKCHEDLMVSYRYILSYSDQQYNKFEHQHRNAKHKSGGIYKFSGFEYIGETSEEWHVIDKDGNRFHRSRAYRRMLAHNLALCEGRGLAVERKTTGNRDRVWPEGLEWATDATLPEDKLWTLEQVRDAMGFTRERRPPKDKWLLDLNQF